MIVDAHVHFWDPERGDDILVMRREDALRKRFQPADLRPLFDDAGVSKCVVVQSAPATAETRYLLDIVRDLPWVYGVVGWIDLERDDVADVCAALRSTGPLVGVRVMLNRIADERWIARPAVRRGLEALAAADLSLDLLAEPRHIAYMRQALISVPDLRAIINHGATPPIAAGSLEPWASSLAELARDTSAWCKFSALREVAGADVSDARILPYARQILSAFGTRRLLWASNWPVCNLAGGFAAWWASAHALLDQLGIAGAERDAILGGNALRAYRTTPFDTPPTAPS